MHRFEAPLEPRTLTAHDGTRVAYYVVGRGPRTMLVPPGVGTPLITWQYIADHLQDRYTMYIADPRGMHGSGMPSEIAGLGVVPHARDLEAIVEAEGLEDAVVLGWSMGVQIGLEFQHRNPHRVRAMVLINGACEHVLETAFDAPGGRRTMRAIARGMVALGPALSVGVRALMRVGKPATMQRLGLVTRNVEGFGRMFWDLTDVDWPAYVRTMLVYDEHSAVDYLPQVGVPVLVTAGGRDTMTPVAIARRMCAQLPQAELVVFVDGTHYTHTEFFEQMNRALDDFLGRVDGA